MRRPDARLHILVLALALTAPWGPVAAADRSVQEGIASQLMCYCGCANLDVKTCTCGTAAGIRREIASLLDSGETPEQVLASFVERHGEQILASPVREGFNLLAWIAPLGAVLTGAVILIFVVRKWGSGGPRGEGSFSSTDDGSAGGEEERELLSRVEREIKEGF